MGSIPRIGHPSSRLDDLTHSPQAEVLGTVDPTLTTPPAPLTTAWTGDSGNIDLTETPPPWEQSGGEYEASDARRYVTVPDNWELRWINPRLLESVGWRYWQAVSASDARVKVKVTQMVAPDGTVRRGGAVGDILGWMYKSWVASRREQLAKETIQLTASAVSRQEGLIDEFARGAFGPGIRIETARHPTHTMGEGRSMRD